VADLKAQLAAAETNVATATNALREAELRGSLETLVRAMDAGDVVVLRRNNQLEVIMLSRDTPEEIQEDLRWYLMTLALPIGERPDDEDLTSALQWLANPTYVTGRFTIPIDSAFSAVLFKRPHGSVVLDVDDADVAAAAAAPAPSPKKKKKRPAPNAAPPAKKAKKGVEEEEYIFDDGESDDDELRKHALDPLGPEWAERRARR
jgi:PHD/YefM family antitoxin component YafN of YafNO toxin-antitoxin module